MPLHTWWTFAIATFFISGTPGPNMLHMMTSGMRHGLRPTFYTMAGCMLAVLAIISASAAGMGTLLETSPYLFDVLRVFGAAYLIYLGIKIAFQPEAAPIDQEISVEVPESAAPAKIFRGGFMVGISNPKLLLFATAFFPQFIDKSVPQLPQFGILLGSFIVIELGWYMTYAAGGSRIAQYLRRQSVQKIFNRLIGSLFAGFGILLLKYKHA
jgi:threonine/homoserine/homoserine lactone efflux protein